MVFKRRGSYGQNTHIKEELKDMISSKGVRKRDFIEAPDTKQNRMFGLLPEEEQREVMADIESNHRAYRERVFMKGLNRMKEWDDYHKSLQEYKGEDLSTYKDME